MFIRLLFGQLILLGVIVGTVRAEFRVLHEFKGAEDEVIPSHTLAIANGFLYSKTRVDGEYGRGTIFRLRTDGTDFAVLHEFTPDEGFASRGGLVVSGSRMFALNSFDSLTVFSLALDGSDLKVAHTGAVGGVSGNPTLLGGWVYGLTGDAFRVDTNGNNFQTLHTFVFPDVPGSYASLTVGDERLYGATTGAVFSMRPDGADYRVLRTFPGGPTDGGGLWMTPILSQGTLYGMTGGGGQHNRGTVYKLSADGADYQVLHNFASGGGGQGPTGALALSGRSLYGFTRNGDEPGVIFRVNTDGSDFRVLQQLAREGVGAYGTPLLANGTLYGSTWGGTIFALDVYRPGDFDANGVLDVADFNYLSDAIREGTNFVYDVNMDNSLNAADLDYWSTELVPEPSTWALALVATGACLLLLRHRRLNSPL